MQASFLRTYPVTSQLWCTPLLKRQLVSPRAISKPRNPIKSNFIRTTNEYPCNQSISCYVCVMRKKCQSNLQPKLQHLSKQYSWVIADNEKQKKDSIPTSAHISRQISTRAKHSQPLSRQNSAQTPSTAASKTVGFAYFAGEGENDGLLACLLVTMANRATHLSRPSRSGRRRQQQTRLETEQLDELNLYVVGWVG